MGGPSVDTLSFAREVLLYMLSRRQEEVTFVMEKQQGINPTFTTRFIMLELAASTKHAHSEQESDVGLVNGEDYSC